ncbi:type 2 lanthipeptide synthetase LanM [Pantoea agglomerans]|uniref:type 2 lanthipeptide synthetase LanM n=1 Tax=Pantoea TaxID=53335 RepID=UPI00320989E9
MAQQVALYAVPLFVWESQMKYNVTEPHRAYLYFPHLENFHLKINELLSAHNLTYVDYSAVLTHIGETLDQIYLPDFVISFDIWLSLQPASVTDRYTHYFKNSDGSWRSSISKQNAYIEKLAAHICASTLGNLSLFLDRLDADFSLLEKIFGIQALTCASSIEILGGDRHENGQQPILLTLNDQRIIYKPRDSCIESVLNEICEIIGMKRVCPETLSRNTHLWQAYIDNRPLHSLGEARDVYRQYGNILALVDLLNINDCHFDNFIVDQNRVFLIDAETSFQYYFEDNPDLERSVYQSGLLQSEEVVINGIGHTSALTAATNIFQSYTHPHALNDASERIQVRYEHGFIKKTQNYPHFEGKPVQSLKYVPDVIQGYEESYEKIKQKSDDILACITAHDEIKPRYLIRTTAYYMLVINKIIHPDVSRTIDTAFPSLINEYLLYESAHPRFKSLVNYEAQCLKNFDIPIFYIRCNTKSLFDSNGKVIKDFLTQTPLEQIKSNFLLPASYLIRQRELIVRSMHAHLGTR